MVHDNIPDGIKRHIRSSLQDLEQQLGPVNDTLDTLRHLAGPLVVGIEDDFTGFDRLLQALKERFAFYETHGAWASEETIRLKMPKATAPPKMHAPEQPNDK